MARVQTRTSRPSAARRAGVGLLSVLALLAVVGCSPEDARVRGGGLGADVGNTTLPIQMHGDRSRNNPDFQVPLVGGVPRADKGVPGWWAVSRAR